MAEPTLSSIDRRLSVIEDRLTILADHEDRIRDLEKARYQSAIIISIATAALSSAAVALILKVIQ